MKQEFEPKKLLEVSEINRGILTGSSFVKECETIYQARVDAVADAIVSSGSAVVMLAGPSASGKTTSAHKVALSLRRHGKNAEVVSLDNFFRNITEYPKTAEGMPDMEHLLALDVDRVNRCLKELIATGASEMPIYDFLTQRRSDTTLHIEAGRDDIVIIEGIHALNPALSASIAQDAVFRMYVGLRTEYCVDGRRVVSTRDLRITRRLVRDYLFRGHSVRNTLELWNRLRSGEEQWIKPFKEIADTLLDTSHPYEPGVFLPILQELCSDSAQGGEFRDVLDTLLGQFSLFDPVVSAIVPSNSMLREFIGGLEL